MRSPPAPTFPFLKFPRSVVIPGPFPLFSPCRNVKGMKVLYWLYICNIKWNLMHHWNPANKICLILFILWLSISDAWPFVRVRVCISSVCACVYSWVIECMLVYVCEALEPAVRRQTWRNKRAIYKMRAWKKSWLTQCVGEKGTLGANSNCT